MQGFRTRSVCGISAVSMLAAAFFGAAAICAEPREKIPVPDEQARAETLKVIAEIYESEWKAVRTSAEKTALAEKMLQQASQTRENPAGYFELLRIARDVAGGAGDVKTSFSAITLLDSRFKIDATAMKVEALLTAAKEARSRVHSHAIAEEAIALIVAALAKDDYATAERVANAGQGAARESRQADLVRRYIALRREMDRIFRAYDAILPALRTVEQRPTDPGANLAVGRFLCFVRGDWRRGVAMLALGNDEQLAPVAKKELKKPATAEEQIAIADAWWKLAESAEEAEAKALMRHAAVWYATADSHLPPGLLKAKIAKRLLEAKQLGTPLMEALEKELPIPTGAGPRVRLGDGCVLRMTFEPKTIARSAGGVQVLDQSGRNNHGSLHGAQPVSLGRAGTALKFDGRDDCIILPSLRNDLVRDLKAVTVCAWFQVAGQANTKFVLDVGFYASGSISVYFQSAKTISFNLPWGGGRAVSAGLPGDGQWHCFVGTWDGAKQSVYIDGKLKSSVDTPSFVLNTSTLGSHAARIGGPAKKDNRGKFRYFSGMIDDVAVFTRALGEEEIESLYNTQSQGRALQ